MSKYFTMGEMVRSEVAERHGIKNLIPKDLVPNVKNLMEKVLDPIREKWGKPIAITSGYRSPELNKLLPGASPTSDHMKGCAADITTGSKAENKKLFWELQKWGIEFDQLINEHDYSWIHISHRPRGNRSQVLSL